MARILAWAAGNRSRVSRINRSRKLEYTARGDDLVSGRGSWGARAISAQPPEVGVLLAENGNLPRAREVLIHSVTLSLQAATWINLQVVHTRLGYDTNLPNARLASSP